MAIKSQSARKAFFAKTAGAGRYAPRSGTASAPSTLAQNGLEPAPLQPSVGKPPAELGARQIENRYIPR